MKGFVYQSCACKHIRYFSLKMNTHTYIHTYINILTFTMENPMFGELIQGTKVKISY